MMISIAMASCNGSRYIMEQLESFVEQTTRPEELVICDDCSTDGTIDIIENFARISPFSVRLIKNERRLGFVRNFEKALYHCKGDIVFLSDQDDVWFDCKIGFISGIFSSHPKTQVVINNFEIADAQLNSCGISCLDMMRKAGLRKTDFVSGCCTAIRSGWRDYVLPFPEGILAHDVWIHALAIHEDMRLILDDVLQYHRRHSNNVSNDYGLESRNAPSTLWFKLRNVLKDASESWLWEIHKRRKLQERLLDRRMPGAPPAQGLDAVIRRMDREIAFLQRRLALVSQSRVRRTPAIVRLLATGSYDYGRGWRSAVRDFLAPCVPGNAFLPATARDER